MDIIGYKTVGKRFEYVETIHRKFEKSIVTKINTLNELVENVLPDITISILEKIFPIDHILVVRIVKDEKTIGSFTLIFYKDQNNNDEEMLKLFASQVGLFIDKKKSDQKSSETIQRFRSLLKNSVSAIAIVDNEGNYVDVSDSSAD